MRKSAGIVIALTLSLAPASSIRSQPPGGGDCAPTGYTLHCRHTCVYEQGLGGECTSEGEEPEGSYCVQVDGLSGGNACHDGPSDPCCSPAPVL